MSNKIANIRYSIINFSFLIKHIHCKELRSNYRGSIFLILTLIFCISETQALGQKMVINKIFITGNHITALKVIKREFTFEEGDSISNIEQHIEQTKTNLQNTRLFHKITITYVEHSSLINITIDLVERWYFWPIPILEYADPNLATWLRRQDFDYINYGIILNHRNVAGLNQDLKIKLRMGIREQYGIVYSVPQIKRNKNLGLYVDVSLFRQKEIHEKIIDYRYHDLLQDDYIYHEIRALGGIKWRPGFFIKHTLYGGFRNVIFDKSIDSIFNSPITNNTKYLVLAHTTEYFRGDYITYPLKGLKIFTNTEVGVNRNTYGFSIFQVGYHKPIATKVTASISSDAFISYTKNYPHFVYAGPGKTYYMRGFEDYVSHNDLFIISRYQLKYTILNRKEFNIKQIKTNKFNAPFLSIFANAFAEAGYTQNIHRSSHAKFPLSVGLGMDFLTYYDWVGRIEVTSNNRNEQYVNIHWGYIF